METIHRNIYQNFLITAMKMHHYIHSWKLNVIRHPSSLLSQSINVSPEFGTLIPMQTRSTR
ncbi:uncharacterized protein PHACADRAFT_252611 [Phanerochaete carnosa HHB-10118-sp]|uniref:Uncharacterized protein n=1 Tax=Phanerochaete carnosa (strain HHB-10118-sp) TaxID=650164 RepID=K5WGZ8_PHACS|nr:uncharacterized protein PHACADRAFT_252611 [Phanerochaete carnosa HHB-10118-sp]EKM58354.1 hypothetical protein PHACADRAFT_252611 [Phanerochaete carnosa HHB-10118-sp]